MGQYIFGLSKRKRKWYYKECPINTVKWEVVYVVFIMWFTPMWVGVSTGRSGSCLCPTHNQPDDIGFPVRKPAANRKNQQVKSDRIGLISSWIGWSRRRCCRRFLLGDNLYFSLDLRRICAKLTRSEKKKNQIVAEFVPNSRDLSKKIKLSPDLSKTQHIFIGSEP